MKAECLEWLSRNFIKATARVKPSDLKRIEKAYGDLDEAYKRDGFSSIFIELAYNTLDKSRDRPSGSKLVCGILIAQDFDPRALAAARVVPGLEPKTYGVKLQFANA